MTVHSPDCPAAVTADTPDYDPEDCRGGSCAAAAAATRDSAPWAPFEISAPPAPAKKSKAGAA